MPDAAERKRLSRQAAARREAVVALQIAEATCRFGAAQLANGTSPEQARESVLYVAGELVSVAEALRRLVRLDGPARRQLARQLHGLGVPVRQIAAQVGVSERSVRYYLRGRRPGRS